MTSFQWVPLPASGEGQRSERMSTAEGEKGVRGKNGGTGEVSHIPHGDDRMGGVHVILCALLWF